ncbi:MAG: T9SS type A sorting domain-containing protein, partial [Chitinispirillales bacterium]|nr:T9SS type A sorting domain-containing protein [Chitinispirillales bacterium]
GATWTTATGISSQTPLQKADPVNPAVFYAFGSNRVFVSSDTGKTFTGAGSVGNISWTRDLQVTPGIEGHVWVAGLGWDNGTHVNPVQGSLARSTDGGATFHTVDPESNSRYTQRVQHSEAIGFGKAAPGAEYPAIYIYGTIDNIRGIWQSIDEARSWVRVDDDKHGFGSLANGNFVRGDMNTFGVVYRSTAGRGIAARMPADWQSSSIRQPTAVRRPNHSPHARLRGQTLTLNPLGSGPLRVTVHDLRGRIVFNRTYVSQTTLRSRDMVRSQGSYIVTVQNAARETVFSGKFMVVKH